MMNVCLERRLVVWTLLLLARIRSDYLVAV